MRTLLLAALALLSMPSLAQTTTGTFTGTLYELGGSDSAEVSIRWEKDGNRVTLWADGSATILSNGGGSLLMSGLPAELQAQSFQYLYPCAGLIDAMGEPVNFADSSGTARVQRDLIAADVTNHTTGWVRHMSGGILAFHASTVRPYRRSDGTIVQRIVASSEGFTTSGKKGIGSAFTVSYAVN